MLALISQLFHTTLLATVAGALSICGFVAHIRLTQEKSMFKKSKLIDLPPRDDLSPQDAQIPTAKENNTTVIARDACFKGNILSDGQLHICGSLEGNIDAKDGVIKIIKGGRVEGDINCRELIVNGNLAGHCICDSLEISENGKVTGTITYNTLTIKQGGTFSGQANALLLDENTVISNVANTITSSRQAPPHSQCSDIYLPSGQEKTIN
ncbi:polymer-forming cytoskeletal protein [Salmonella enterica subsp. enterica serovar Schwarzengrund]|nr:polymer-forming cytoskeletal protein [Salmonella enterica subsp. enterica serovar Schwarzengrund]